jgi:tetratricopeptide (TPR) repeat protein
MSGYGNFSDPSLYNPASEDPQRLLERFIDRKRLLERILGIVRDNGPARPQQHVLLIGPRGMGKTTLLCAIKYRVLGDAELDKAWLPLLFQEEHYGIGDLADFWLEAIRHLESALQRPLHIVERLLEQDHDDLAETAQQRFFELLAETGKRALLLIDNLNDIFNDIDDGHALNRLRALWMTDPRCMVVGASPSYFDQVTKVDQAFHDFFRIFTLDRLTQDELESFLRRVAELQGDDGVLRIIENEPQRVAALRVLTGGNPRLIMLGCRVLRDGFDGDVRRDLERLLDESTPFFKHRIDSLAKEARRTFDAIARRWDPVTVDDVRKELRKPSNYVSAQIKRLIDEGFIEETGGGKKKSYQVSERFYNVYYLMRYSREGRRRLHWLVGFMQTFYSRHDYKAWARRLDGELAGAESETRRADTLAHLHALSAAADGDGRAEAFSVIVRDAVKRNDRRALDEEIAGGDPVESHSWRYLAAEMLWLLPPERRKPIGFRPEDAVWSNNLMRQLAEAQLTAQAEACICELGGWRTDTAVHAYTAGTLLEWFFSRHQEAEAAYRQALELDPQYAAAWNNLGNALNNQRRYEEAEAAYRQALEIDPQDAAAWINLSGTYLLDLKRLDSGIPALLRGLSLDPEESYGRYVLGLHWQAALPEASRLIAANEGGADNLRRALTEVLLEEASKKAKRGSVKAALSDLDETQRLPFEPLLLALQALEDRAVLYRIAREKRDLVLDVIAQIAPEKP